MAVLKLTGEIDLQESPGLRAILREKSTARCPALLVDFSAVTYIDSSGLATLIEYRRDLQAFAGQMALFGMDQRVRTIFDLVRLGDIFPIFETVDEASAALKS